MFCIGATGYINYSNKLSGNQGQDGQETNGLLGYTCPRRAQGLSTPIHYISLDRPHACVDCLRNPEERLARAARPLTLIVQTFSSCTSRPDVCLCPVVPIHMDDMSTNDTRIMRI